MNDELENLRDKLNHMLDSYEYSNEDVLEASENLDKLIVKYYKIFSDGF